jgi:sulfane dehydrogenase subunit SoxC
MTSRRQLLGFGLTTMAGLTTARLGAAEEFPPEGERTLGQPILAAAYGQPSPHEAGVRRQSWSNAPLEQASSMTPLGDLHGSVTPNGLFYERHHSGVPDIAPEQHRLVIHGAVRRPLALTLEDLLRFPSVSRVHFLECTGNTGSELIKPTRETVQGTHGLLSSAEWTGVPLSLLLDAVGLLPEGLWLLAEGADAGRMTRSVPIAKALDDALVAYAQNGEALRPEQGYPVRLLLPGWGGNLSVKWLRRLKVAAEPFYTREETSKYTDLMPDGRARIFTWAMDAKSVITHPSGGQTLNGGPGWRQISGLAWSGRGKITAVEVSTDGGLRWQIATLQEPILSKCLTRFSLPWEWHGEPAVLQSRAIDETGYRQPTREQLIAARGTHGAYHNNAIQSWRVDPSGKVSNIHG